MAIGQFNKGAGASASKGAPKKSKWSGVKSAQPRDPIIHAGVYRLEIVGAESGRTGEYFKVHFAVADQNPGQTMHAQGDKVMVLFRTVDDAGQSRCKAFFVAAAGYDDDSGYDEADPNGEMIDALFERGEDSALKGRLVDVRVSRGKDKEDGDYYREFEWSPVPDAEQPK